MRAALRELLFTEDKLYPPRLGNLAAWFDALDTQTMLSGNGSVITDGGVVALWSDKSGNSGVNCLVLPGAVSNGATVPDASGVDITGNIDIRVWARAVDWTPAASMLLLAKSDASAQIAYTLGLNTNGTLAARFSSNGAVNAGEIVFSSVAVSFSDFQAGWCRVTRDSTSGNVLFYTSLDGVTWAQLGTTQTTAAYAIFNSNQPVAIGSTSNLGGNPFAGSIFRAQIYASTDGTDQRLDIDFSTIGKKLANGDTFVCATGQTVTLNSSGATGARIAGERDLFQGTLANRPVYMNYAGTKYGWVPDGSTDGITTPDVAAYDAVTALDIKIRVKRDWSAAGNGRRMISKWRSTGNLRSFSFGQASAAANTPQLFISGDGSATQTIAPSTTLSGAQLTDTIWLRVTWRASDQRVQYFTATDQQAVPSSWTQLGTDVTMSGAVAALFKTSDVVRVFAGETAVVGSDGRIFYASIATAIDGAPVSTFNPALYTSGTTFTASTGEVWTVNGGAHIVTRTGLYFDGGNDYLKTAAFSLSQPVSGYSAISQISWSSNDVLFDGGSPTVQIGQLTSTPRLGIPGGSNDTFIDSLALGEAGALSFRWAGSSSYIRKNREAADAGTGPTTAPNGFTVGANGSGTQPANAFISEVAIYSAAHATATQDRMALYAGRKWGFAA